MSLDRLQVLQGQYHEEQEWALAFMKQGGEGYREAMGDWSIARKRLAAVNFLMYLELNPQLTDEERVTAFMVTLP